ncbi:hypothetical protein T492DRAFT_415842 [Pavlovales sp. CCMP2436]|nr:hypothetical protein T492DRAFT_415842 [Pavlovales sp. CCMP2436]
MARAGGTRLWHASALVAALRRAGRASVLKRAKLATKTTRLERLKSYRPWRRVRSNIATARTELRPRASTSAPSKHRGARREPMLSVATVDARLLSRRCTCALRAHPPRQEELPSYECRAPSHSSSFSSHTSIDAPTGCVLCGAWRLSTSSSRAWRALANLMPTEGSL